MSKLNDLIKNLCPTGVKYEQLGNVCDVIVGFSFKASLFKSEGLPIVKTTNIQDGYIDETNMVYFDINDYTNNLENYIIYPNDIVLGMSGTIKVGINNTDKKYYLNQRVCKFKPHKELNNKFLYYILNNSINKLTDATSGSSVKNLSNENIKSLLIPVPPLEIQCEIVKILDAFTAISLENSSVLSSEIVARKKQFEFYKDELYSFKDKNVEYVKLKDIAEIIRGGNFQKKDFVENGKPCIHYGQIYTKYGASADTTFTFVSDEVFNKSKQAKPNDIVMAVTSENVEDVCKCVVWCGNEDIAVSGHTAIIHHNINAKYLGYYFSTSHFYNEKVKLVHGTKVMEVTPSSLNEVLIPLPSPEEQERIANLVEKYDKACGDFISKIPVEIEKRQKQYDFYRDKLLSFKEAEVNE